jgi:hypothetical protein
MSRVISTIRRRDAVARSTDSVSENTGGDQTSVCFRATIAARTAGEGRR